MVDLVELGSVRCAELAAPAISRAFVSGMLAGRSAGRALVESYGGPSVGYVIDLRNPLVAQRALSEAELAAVYRYIDEDTRRSTIEASVVGGLLEQEPNGAVRASQRGLRFLSELFDHHARILAERWDAAVVGQLNPLLARLLDAAADTGGEAWNVQAPPFEPAGLEPSVVLLNRLSTMRYHRADAHAAAWQTAGWNAEQIAAMPWGTAWTDERFAIEADTNVRAAAPYGALTAEQRLTLLASLAALA
jgi:hypothetical protein